MKHRLGPALWNNPLSLKPVIFTTSYKTRLLGRRASYKNGHLLTPVVQVTASVPVFRLWGKLNWADMEGGGLILSCLLLIISICVCVDSEGPLGE